MGIEKTGSIIPPIRPNADTSIHARGKRNSSFLEDDETVKITNGSLMGGNRKKNVWTRFTRAPARGDFGRIQTCWKKRLKGN